VKVKVKVKVKVNAGNGKELYRYLFPSFLLYEKVGRLNGREGRREGAAAGVLWVPR